MFGYKSAGDDSTTADERAPLVQFPGSYIPPQQDLEALPDAYSQFCYLIGIKPVDHSANKTFTPPRDSLYSRAVRHRDSQSRIYALTSTLTNTLLLSQIILGAALTGLGAANYSPVLVTVFGALNTVIAGLVAFLKSRGQPMRARMFRDDLNRVVDEIENSATMWKGISHNVHGYDAIDTNEAVTVRSEVARLTRLYDRAVKTNTMNNPDFYGAGINNEGNTSALRNRSTQQPLLPVVQPQVPASVGPAIPPVQSSLVPDSGLALGDTEESPATKPVPPTSSAPKKEEKPAPESTSPAPKPSPPPPQDDAGVPTEGDGSTAPTSAPVGAMISSISSATPDPSSLVDPDASPATALKPPQADRAKSKVTSSKVTKDLSKKNPTAASKGLVDGISAEAGAGTGVGKDS